MWAYELVSNTAQYHQEPLEVSKMQLHFSTSIPILMFIPFLLYNNVT